ncbi:hypothetical protein [Novipirellula aureliae]|nr:hypothetical protein [Novipirellula aureliae]
MLPLKGTERFIALTFVAIVLIFCIVTLLSRDSSCQRIDAFERLKLSGCFVCFEHQQLEPVVSQAGSVEIGVGSRPYWRGIYWVFGDLFLLDATDAKFGGDRITADTWAALQEFPELQSIEFFYDSQREMDSFTNLQLFQNLRSLSLGVGEKALSQSEVDAIASLPLLRALVLPWDTTSEELAFVRKRIPSCEIHVGHSSIHVQKEKS